MSGPAPLRQGLRVLLLDLDGVVWHGTRVLEGAVAAARRAQEAGTAVRAVTNNASSDPAGVAARLARAGLPLDAADVVTSATAAAEVLAERLPPVAAVLVCGAPALRAAVEAAGLRVVVSATERPDAVVTGWSDALAYEQQAQAALAVRAGAWWLATNMDATMPSERGALPGAGALAAVVAVAAGVPGPADVAGKPGPRLHRTALRGADAGTALGVGDRLETDVAAARAAGVRALAVLSGVATLADVLAAEGDRRPDDVGVDLTVLDAPARDVPPPAPEGREVVVGHAVAVRRHGVVELDWAGGDAPAHDAARALLTACPPGVGPARVRLGDGALVLRDTLPGLVDVLAGD